MKRREASGFFHKKGMKMSTDTINSELPKMDIRLIASTPQKKSTSRKCTTILTAARW